MPESRQLPTSKTYEPADLHAPATKEVAVRLRWFALRLALAGVPFAVNGILKERFWVRRHKLWEYARGIEFLAAAGVVDLKRRNTSVRILDFGGAATLPVLYLATLGCEVLSLDTDTALGAHTNQVAAERGWNLWATPFNLVTSPPPPEWGLFDAVISFSVLEHIPQHYHTRLIDRLAALTKPNGVLALTFDFGADAPQPYAIRTLEEVAALVEAAGAEYCNGMPLRDTGSRYVLDKRFPHSKFTFASLFLRRPAKGGN